MSNMREDIANESELLANETKKLADKHYTTALRWNRVNFWQGTVIAIATPILSIGTTSSIIVQYFIHSIGWGIFSFSLSLAVTILTSVIKLHKPSEKGASHEKAGHDFTHLSDQARLLSKLDVYDENKTDQDLETKLREMIDQKFELSMSSISLPSWVL